MNNPEIGQLYWVTDGESVHFVECVGRVKDHWWWSDGVGWDEFGGKVIAWKHIAKPTAAEVMETKPERS